MNKLREKLERAESDYARLQVINPLLNPIESLLLDVILAGSVQADFENAPENTPFAIWLDDDILGAGAHPRAAAAEARAQLIEWELNARRDAQLEINPPAYILPRSI